MICDLSRGRLLKFWCLRQYRKCSELKMHYSADAYVNNEIDLPPDAAALRDDSGEISTSSLHHCTLDIKHWYLPRAPLYFPHLPIVQLNLASVSYGKLWPGRVYHRLTPSVFPANVIWALPTDRLRQTAALDLTPGCGVFSIHSGICLRYNP